MNRKTFLQATLATSLAGLVACSGEGEDPAGGGDGDGDLGSGGAGTGGGPGTGGAGSGGAGTGGVGSGGGPGTGGVGSGGDSTTGGAGTGGGDVGAGGSDVSTGGGDVGTGGGDVGTGGEAGSACATVMTEWVDNHEQGAHAFMMEVSAADVEAGVEKVYNVQGASQHPHTLTVTAQNFTDLATNGMVELLTSEDFGHDHTIILTCGA